MEDINESLTAKKNGVFPLFIQHMAVGEPASRINRPVNLYEG